MIEVALILAGVTLIIGIGAAFCLRLLPTVRLQVAGLALLAVVLPLAAVLASGWVMFHMHDDAKILAVSSAAALSAVAGALLLGRWIVGPLERLRGISGKLPRRPYRPCSRRGSHKLGELAVAFNKMAHSIERLFEARRQLVAGASHDLRTPLSSLQAMLEALEDGLAEPDEYLPNPRPGANPVHSRRRSVRADAHRRGRAHLGTPRIPLDSLVESCVRGFEADARAKRIRLETRRQDRLPTVRCAPEKVERILQNLLTNALRHTPVDGAVAVVVSAQSRAVTVAVEDSGAGLTGEVAQRMFERFWRADPSRTADGSGLGLAIAQGLVEAQGGHIWAENRPTGGARLAFTLPLARARSLAEAAVD